MEQQKPHVAILPSPGMGHLIPLAEFAKRLFLCHGFHVTFIVPTLGPLSASQKAFLDALPAGITHLLLPPVSLDDLPANAKIETQISLTVARSLPSLYKVFKSLVDSSEVAALVVDLFATDAFDVAVEFKVSPYVFFPSTAMCLSLCFHLPKLDQAVTCEYRDLPEPVRIPGCIPVHGRDLFDPVHDRKNDAYKWILHHSTRFRLAEGIIVNSFEDLEPGSLRVLQDQGTGNPPIYPVGPLVQMAGGGGVDGSGCLRWLDDQPNGSVLFISFGSGGTLSYDQLIELAFGLEMSEQRFMWVVRSPNDEVANANYFTVHSTKDPFAFLPKGFLERTKGLGLVVPSWAPQAQILRHRSAGGFLSHCGWNSVLESIINGVPLIAWPLYAEQKMNAVMLTEDIKVALRPKAGENELVGRAEIARVVKSLIEGEQGKELRSRMRDLKDASGKVLADGGPSARSLAELAEMWKKKKKAARS
ncbi:hydroquinone glucosyltransferase-like [Diospyros lotus]|uniref:hydroquinone glucosyltransferase-like n=1 Tax=Diospyros lotus TaxID=55363 RepID=UPI00224F8568|nr:hydroquinone glucosyltransferase-like [Diospyros lotus]